MKIISRNAELKATWLALKAVGAHSKWVGGALADKLWFTPWDAPLSERALAKQRAWLEGTEPMTVTVGGRRLMGFTRGEGPAVLLVHGWADRAATMGAFVTPLVEAGHRVVAVDLPAHGASPGRRTDAPQIAETIMAVDEMVGGLHGVIGHSMGAHGTMVALRDGLRPERVVFLAPSVDFRHTMERFVPSFGIPEKAAEGLKAWIERRYGATIWDDFLATDLVRDVGVPALIVHDRDDDQIDVADSEALAAVWPSARLEITTGLSHTKLTRDPGVLRMAVDFITAEQEATLYARV